MSISRRSFIKFLIGTAAGAALAETIDVERLLWVPTPIITVPELAYGRHNLGQTVAQCWSDAIKHQPMDTLFHDFWLLSSHDPSIKESNANKLIVITDV